MKKHIFKEAELPENDKELIPFIFEGSEIRSVFDEGEWKFCIADCIRVLTKSKDPAHYWRQLKLDLKKQGAFQSVSNPDGLKSRSNESVRNPDGLKFKRFKTKASDGKGYLMEYATMEELFRIVQSVPSPKAEPFKQAVANKAAQKVKEAMNPDLAIASAVEGLMRRGYAPKRAEARVRSAITRVALTQAWKEHGIRNNEYAQLTDLETKETFGKTTAQFKRERGIITGSAKDGMTLQELSAQAVSDATITLLVEKHDPYGYAENALQVIKGSKAGKAVLETIEKILAD